MPTSPSPDRRPVSLTGGTKNVAVTLEIVPYAEAKSVRTHNTVEISEKTHWKPAQEGTGVFAVGHADLTSMTGLGEIAAPIVVLLKVG